MIGALTGSIGRDFIIGYFLPFATFIAAILGLALAFGFEPVGESLNDTETLVASTVLAFSSALGGVILLALNREIIRLMKGYPCQYRFLNRVNWNWWQLRRYRKLRKLADDIRSERDDLIKQGKHLPSRRQAELEETVAKLATYFPDEEKWVLPTGLGNTIRAFEVYPRVMYGIEATEGWSRLLGVIPIYYRHQINSTKAQMDFWVNLWLLSILFIPIYAIFVIFGDGLRIIWAPAIAVFVAYIAASRAKGAAVQWGELVKASFDLFLPRLWTKLGFVPRVGDKHRRAAWENFSWAVHYRAPRYLPWRGRK